MSKVIIIVEGGMVQGVVSDDPSLRVEVLDYDLSEFATEEEEAEHDWKVKNLEYQIETLEHRVY